MPSAAVPRLGGFTLIELVVTVAIIGILVSAALPLAELAVKRGKEQELRQSLRQIRTALDEYKRAGDDGRVVRKADESGYPPSLDILVEGVPDAKDPAKKRLIYFLRRVPADPFAEDTALPAARSWGLRSYDSPHDSPREGRDVFDVYSLAPGIGLNGVPYRQW
jgi:general secretion pathway protein G